MIKYRRFVAYVYEYQKGRKGKNCGFIRVEAWEERCRLEIHLVCPGLMPGVRCDVFAFVRNAGLMDGSLVGTCETGENSTDCIIETDRNHMGEAGISLAQTGGMILITENGAFFGTEWDDQPVRPENFHRLEPVMEKNIAEKNMPQDKEWKTETEKALREEEKTESKEMEEETEKQKVQTGKEIPGQSETENAPEVSSMTEEEAEREKHGELKKTTEAKDLRTQSVAGAELEIPRMAELDFGEEFDPFEDGEMSGCRKIQLTDFRYFHPRDRALRNNRFLQYGLYSFGHLMVGRLKTGEFVLGVPGAYDPQERFMANMFGFPYFKNSGQLMPTENRGGYWYRLINAPDVH